MSACEYADRNLLPFFRRWHFPCSTIAIRYMKQFRELGEDEQFWTSYDGSTVPSFESRTPNKSIVRPSSRLKFDMADGDDKLNWYLRGVAWDYNAYNDPVNPGATRSSVPMERRSPATRSPILPGRTPSTATPAIRTDFSATCSRRRVRAGHISRSTF